MVSPDAAESRRSAASSSSSPRASPQPAYPCDAAALYSSVEFARTLAALQRGSPVLKWSKRAQAPRARVLTLRIPVDDEPAAVAALVWPRAAASALLPAWAAPSRAAPHVLRLGNVQAVHALGEAAPLPALLPGCPAPHAALSLSYVVAHRGSASLAPRPKTMLLLWPEDGAGRTRFGLEARCLLYGVHAGCLGLDAGAGFDAGFARFLLRAPLDAAAALINEKIGANRLVTCLDAAWFGAPRGPRHAADAPEHAHDMLSSEAAAASPKQYPSAGSGAEDIAVVASQGRVRLMVDGIELALAPCMELDALLRALPAGARPRGLGSNAAVLTSVAAASAAADRPDAPPPRAQEGEATPPVSPARGSPVTPARGGGARRGEGSPLDESPSPEVAGEELREGRACSPVAGCAASPTPWPAPPPPRGAAEAEEAEAATQHAPLKSPPPPPPVSRPPPPPPPPPPMKKAAGPPPPPPPPPRRGNGVGGAAAATGDVRPSREAVAAFRELTRLQNLAQRRKSASDAAPSSATQSHQGMPRFSASAAASADGGPSDVRGAIEANSPYIAAVRRDVEVHGGAIPALAVRAREARAESGDLAPVRACLAALDAVLGALTDERAVLKHFDWPEAKVDAMREAVALQDECAALRAGLEQWRAAAASPGAAAARSGVSTAAALHPAAPPPPGAPLAAVQRAAARALEKAEPRVESLVREQEALRAKFTAHGLAFDLGAELRRVRHAAVAVAAVLLSAATAGDEDDDSANASTPDAGTTAPAAEPASRRAAAAARGSAEAEAAAEAALRLSFRVHQFAGGFDAATEARFLRLGARLQARARSRAGEDAAQ